MRDRLLDVLVCPDCQLRLTCTVHRRRDGQIWAGELRCAQCAARFPIRGGVPRILSNPLDSRVARTARSFGWQWNRFHELGDLATRTAQFFDWAYPLAEQDFAGRFVLDAGCGMGRFAEVVAHFGAADVVAVDIGAAVDVTAQRLAPYSNAHVVQADIHRLPFVRGGNEPASGFDVVYCLGVLHHLPVPAAGFHALVEHVRPGGLVAVWVYGRENNDWIIRYINPLRERLFSRMDPASLYHLATFLALGLHPVLKLGYLNSGWLKLPYGSYLHWLAQYPFRHTHQVVFDHLAPAIAHYVPRQELEQWVYEARLEEPRITWRNENSWRAVGRVPAGDQLNRQTNPQAL